MSKYKITAFDKRLHFFMQQSLQQAKLAYEQNEIPVGVLIVFQNKIIAKTHNQTEQQNNFTCHAEMIAINMACNYLNSKYLDDCEIYITLEPCLMCLHALALSRIGRIYYGAFNPQTHSVQKYLTIHYQFQTEIYGGIMEKECGELLTDFFRS